MDILISIIVPIYNEEQNLEKCINSLLNQTYKKLQIIMVDDGSTDKSSVICEVLQKKDSRLHLIYKENGGASSARNIGLKAAQGDYIGFVDADDVCELDMFEQMIALAVKNHADAAFCGFRTIIGKKENITRNVKNGIADTEKALYLLNQKDSYNCGLWNKLISRKVLSENNNLILFNEDYAIGEDCVWLAAVISQCKKIALTKNSYYIHYFYYGSACHSLKIDNKNLSHLVALDNYKNILGNVSKELEDCGRIKLYAQARILLIVSYCTGKCEFEKMRNIMKGQNAKTWFFSREISFISKCRQVLIETAMKMHVGKSVVLYIYNVGKVLGDTIVL